MYVQWIISAESIIVAINNPRHKFCCDCRFKFWSFSLKWKYLLIYAEEWLDGIIITSIMLNPYLLCQDYAWFFLVPSMLKIMPAYLTQSYQKHLECNKNITWLSKTLQLMTNGTEMRGDKGLCNTKN